MSNNRLTYLYHSFLDDTASVEELKELQGYFNDADHQSEILALMNEGWDLPGDELPDISSERAELIYAQIVSQQRYMRPAGLWKRLAVAAVLLVSIGFAGYYYLVQNKPVPQIANNTNIHYIPSGSNKAILRLASGKAIVLNNVKKGQTLHDTGAAIYKKEDGQLVYEADHDQANDNEVHMNSIEVPRGGEYQLYLPDGTHVYLNSNSSLTYPTRFTGKERNVTLAGEAYFEVVRNPKLPFKVNVLNKQTVEVLGTHFNVSAYSDDGEIKTTLVEGLVKVTAQKHQVLLKPGETASYGLNSNLFTTARIDTNEVVGWKNGYFVFNNANIRNIMVKLSRWYDVDFTITGNVDKVNVVGNYNRKKTLLSLLKGIELSNDVKFSVKERRVTVMGE